MESISNQAIIVAAKENFGVAVLPQALVAKDVQRGKLKEVKMLDYELKRTSFVFWHRNKNSVLRKRLYSITVVTQTTDAFRRGSAQKERKNTTQNCIVFDNATEKATKVRKSLSN